MEKKKSDSRPHSPNFCNVIGPQITLWEALMERILGIALVLGMILLLL